MHREGIADGVDGPAQQAGRLARQRQDAGRVLVALVTFLDVSDLLVGRFGQIQQQHDGQIADVARDTDIDARIRHDAAADVDHRTHRGIQVQFLAFLVAAPAHDPLRLHGIDQVADAGSDRFVFLEYGIHLVRITA